MKRFEYKIVLNWFFSETEEHTCKIHCDSLNEFGNDGWELVAIHGFAWIFKRELITSSKPKSQPTELYDDWGGGGE